MEPAELPSALRLTRINLDSYRQARTQLPTQLERLSGLTTDDSSQSGRLKSLTMLIERDMAELGANLAPLEARFSDGRLPAEPAAGVVRTNAIGAAIDTMLAYEQNLLRDDLVTIELHNAIALGIGLLVRTGAISLVVIIIVVMIRKVRRNEKLTAAQTEACGMPSDPGPVPTSRRATSRCPGQSPGRECARRN